MNDEPVYIITSFRRSGSSMMAKCLHEGGLPVAFFERNDFQFNLPPYGGGDGYIPNPNGFFSIEGYTDFEAPSFYDDFKGMVVKVPRADFRILPKGKYKLIVMTRDPVEIMASYRSFIGVRHWGMPEVSLHFYDMIKNATVEAARSREDFDVIEVNYNELMKDPVAAFQRIKDFGIPIDVEKAVSVVDQKLYRHRLTQKN